MTIVPGTSTIISSIPTLVGHYPNHAVAVLAFRRGGMRAATVVDLEAADATRLAQWAVALRADKAVAAVVHGRSDLDGTGAVREYRSFTTDLTHQMARRGVELPGVQLVAHIAEGLPWVCGDGCGAHGALEDPDMTPAAIAGIVDGHHVYPTRQALDHALDLTDPAHTASLAELVEQLGGPPADEIDDPRARLAITAVIRAAKRASAGWALSNSDYVTLAAVLVDTRLRDMLIGLAITAKAQRAEALWRLLARTLPGSARVEALVLAGFFAYARGDRPLAQVAIDTALRLDPAHRLADSLDAALTAGRRGKRIWEMAEIAYHVAMFAEVPMPRPLQIIRRSA